MYTFYKVFTGFLVVMVALVAVAEPQTQNWDTMLVVPARYSVLQIAFDCAHQFKTVLVSYQDGQDGTPLLLYAWNGKEWVYVDTEDYTDASFIKVPPSRVILIGDDSVLPEELVERSGWSANVLSIPTLQTAELLNTLGRHLNFSPYQWKWFSKRYNLKMEDVNVERRQSSWYDGKYDFEEMDRKRVEQKSSRQIPPAPVLEVQPATVDIMPIATVPVEPVTRLEPKPEPAAPDLKAAVDKVEAEIAAEDAENAAGDAMNSDVDAEMEETEAPAEPVAPEAEEPVVETVPSAPQPLKPSAPAPALSLPRVGSPSDTLMMPEE